MTTPPPNTLSEVAVELVNVLTQAIGNGYNYHIGPPIDALSKDQNSVPTIVIFFHRFDHSGFYPDTAVRGPRGEQPYGVDPFYIRIQCLITVFSNGGTTAAGEIITEGELNLRVLGEIILALHEEPVIDFQGTGAQSNIQVVFKTLSSEEINQIWSTQGEATYRTSIAYELALVPIVTLEERVPVAFVIEDGAILNPIRPDSNPPLPHEPDPVPNPEDPS